MVQPQISVIVPVHNAGIYLNKCLSSLVHQTLHNIEIILVLDNPTDGSDGVAEAFAANDDRIRLLYNTENLHTGLSRNRGMDLARGEYIGFMDHDDYCEPSMYEKLYAKAKERNAEIVRSNFSCIYMQNGIAKIEPYNYPEASHSLSDKGWLYEKVSNNTISCVIWNHIYKRDFLEKHEISFLDSRHICSEDSIFFLKAYHHCQSLETIPEYLYSHVFHSSNTGKAYSYRSIEHRIAFAEELHSMLKQYHVNENEAMRYLAQNSLRSLYSGVRQAFASLPAKTALKKTRLITNSIVMQDCIRYIFRKENRQKLFQLKPTIIVLFAIFYFRHKTNIESKR